MMKIAKIAFAVCVVALLCIPAFAEKKTKSQEIYDVNENDVNKFISVFPQMKAAIKEGTSDSLSFLTAVTGMQTQKLLNIAKDNGFKDDKEMIRVCGGVVSAYAILKMKESEVQFDKSLAELPAEMKAMMKTQIGTLKSQLKTYENRVTKGSVDAVQSHYAEMEKLFSEGNE